MSVQTCPCCGSILLRHARSTGSYWLCKSCWQEMPVFTEEEFSPNDQLLSSGEDDSLPLAHTTSLRSAN